MKKIAVVGPIPRDTIITHHKERIQKYGCITHPCIALAKLMQDSGSVFPIAHVHKKDLKPIAELFSKFPAIDMRGVDDSKDMGTVIALEFLDQNNRLEKQTAFMNPILPKDVEAFLEVDAFVMVPITDFEISLETLKYIKANSKAKIIFDAHGATTCLTINGDRLRRFWAERDEWLPYIDVLKMNLEESQCCWFQNEYRLEDMTSYDDSKTEHLDEFAEHVLNQGTQSLFVTLDAHGCVGYHRENGITQKHFTKSIDVQEVIDTTGCGDSFAGGLAYGLVYHNSLKKAAEFANILGGLRTQGKTYEVFKNQKETEGIREKFYSE